MNTSSLEIRADRDPWRDSIAFLMVMKNENGDRSVGKNIIFETIDQSTVVESTFRLSIPNAQYLMDELWRCGLRPTEGTGSAGSLAATQKHLEDMRDLVNKLIDRVIA